MPNVDKVLRDIGQWKFLVISDLLKSFYQISIGPLLHEILRGRNPIQRNSCLHPLCHGHAWLRTCLEELMSRVLGDLIQEGCIAKIADDLYISGDTPEQVLFN